MVTAASQKSKNEWKAGVKNFLNKKPSKTRDLEIFTFSRVHIDLSAVFIIRTPHYFDSFPRSLKEIIFIIDSVTV